MSSFDGSLDSLTGYDSSSSSSSDQRSCSKIKNEPSSDIPDRPDIKNPISVSECIRLHSGDILVKGTIASISQIYKMINSVKIKCENCCTDQLISYPIPILDFPNNLSKCNACNSRIEKIETQYINAVTIEIQDSDTFSEIEKLSCILFGENTLDIQIGSKVLISGSIQIIKQKNKKSISRLYSSTIHYENKEKFELSDPDIQSIRKFKDLNKDSLIETLTKMFAPSIIGLDIIKKGILLSAASSSEELTVGNNIRDRIHLLLVGSPGTGKSRLIKESVKLVPNSRYESSQHASGKSLTAIVSKENDGDYCLRIGPVPSARGAICVLNEIGRTSPEDQGFLLDVMEEGEFTINKYGINAKIKSPTVIIASANPYGSASNNNNGFDNIDKINLDQIPLIKPVIDRFDLVFVVKDSFDEKESREYATKKMNLVIKKIPISYSFLRKYIEYAKQFQPTLNEESQALIKEYYINLVKSSKNNNKFISRRCLDTLIRLVKSFAKLKLKNVVEVEDAKEALEFYNAVIYQYTESTVSIPNDPRNITISVFMDILKNSTLAYSLEDLAKEACKRNEYAKSYLSGNKVINDVFKIGKNRKLRCVYDLLIENSHIARIQEKPIVLQWIENKILSDIYDVYDTSKNKIDDSTEKNNEIAIKTMSDMSYMSDSNPVESENETKDGSLYSDDKTVRECLKSEPMIGYKKPFYYCKEHTSVQFIDYKEILDHLKYSRVHQQST